MKITDALKENLLNEAGWDKGDAKFKSQKLAKFSVGDVVIIPLFDDDQGASSRVLDSQGFLAPKTISIDLGNQTCASEVFTPDPQFTGDRWIAVSASMVDPEEENTIYFIS